MLTPPPFRIAVGPGIPAALMLGRHMFGFDRAPVPTIVRMSGAFPYREAEHRCAYMGQGTTCETTPEGGTLCSDGTYHPPGCPNLPPVRAEEASSGSAVPILIGAGILGVVTAVFALTR
jgi:hypothetical protein